MVYLNRIYTKSGDAGETGLGSGERVRKDSARVQAMGDVDELNAVLGLLHSHCPETPGREMLRRIQNDLFDLGADLCVLAKSEEKPGEALRITADQVTALEKAIDEVNDKLQPLQSFILPGGTSAAAWLHLARTVCRRAERSVVALMAGEPVNREAMIYLNRLSDYLFVLARAANSASGDVLWVPGKNR